MKREEGRSEEGGRAERRRRNTVSECERPGYFEGKEVTYTRWEGSVGSDGSRDAVCAVYAVCVCV